MNDFIHTLRSRRDFMRLAAQGTVASTAWLTLGGATSTSVDTSGYKALVCIYLAGGNNGFNMVVPTTNAAYATYAASRSNLALPQSQLLPLNGRANDGNAYGLHPMMSEVQALFNAGRVAVLGNVGTLVQPTSVSQARAGSVPLPRQLFSHLDQQTEWMTSLPDRADRTGWAGRIADLYVQQGFSPNLAINVTIGGSNYWQEGGRTMPYTLGAGGAPILSVTANNFYRGGTRAQVAQDLINQAAADANLMTAEFANIEISAASKVATVNNAFQAAGDINTVFPSFTADSGLGVQLRQVARAIKARTALDSRQIFFVRLGGFDTHNNELSIQNSLLRTLSANIDAFWQAMNEVGAQNDVTLFTMSDFGRSLGSNGDGSDHAWGNHHLIMGGAVRGGYYGQMPDLTVGGANDVGNGRIVPTSSTDQYGATLTRWFGVPDGQLNTVFPNLANFNTRSLSFLP